MPPPGDVPPPGEHSEHSEHTPPPKQIPEPEPEPGTAPAPAGAQVDTPNWRLLFPKFIDQSTGNPVADVSLQAVDGDPQQITFSNPHFSTNVKIIHNDENGVIYMGKTPNDSNLFLNEGATPENRLLLMLLMKRELMGGD